MTFNKRKDIVGLFNNEPPIFMGSNKLSFILDDNSNRSNAFFKRRIF